MKKIFSIAMLMLTIFVASCGNKVEATNDVEWVATEIVPQAATEVIPCAAPGPDAGGRVATEVIPDSVN